MLEQLKTECPKYDELLDYFRDQIDEFANAPLVPLDKRKALFPHIEGVSFRILEKANTIATLISPASNLISNIKRAVNSENQPVQNKPKYLDLLAKAESELNAIRKSFKQEATVKFVNDMVAHCKQSS
jgi:hypothetical protein